MKTVDKMIVSIFLAGLGAILVSSAITWNGLATVLMLRSVEAQTIKMPLYKPPLPSAPLRRIGAGTRGPENATHAVFALVPRKDIGLTLQEQPTLYWYLSQETTYPIEVSVIRGKGIKSSMVKEWRLNLPLQAGVHPIRLTEHDVRLAPGVLYQWSVALIRDRDDRSQDTVSGGFMRRIDPNDLPAASREELKQLAVASTTDTPQIYVRAGIWYDAVSTLSELITASPQETALRELRASLLEQPTVQLPDVAAYDRQHK
jgi:hypothetical protein